MEILENKDQYGSALDASLTPTDLRPEDSNGVQTRILRALDRVRPYLMVDSGNVELVGFDASTGIVKVQLLGACQNCSMSLMTLRAGIERAIMHEAPEVVRVEAVSLSCV